MKRKFYDEFSYTNNGYLILRSIETYSRTASGKSWKSKPDTVENEIVPPEHYTNYITSIPFFNNWGDGAYCRAAFSYNAPGYLPTTVTSVLPFQQTKKIAHFSFISKSTMLINAGYREKDIVERAKTYTRENAAGKDLIELITAYDETGHADSATYEKHSNKWVN